MNQSASKRVFISYSHDSPSHKDWVLALATRLRTNGIDAWIDRYTAAPQEGWPRWMQRQIEEADFVILVCTETYKNRFEGHDTEGRGVTWEGLIANQILYDNSSRNQGFIPVIPHNGNVNHIPIALRAFTFYRLDDEYEALCRHINDKPEIVPEPLPNPSSLPGLGERLEGQQIRKEGMALGQVPVESEGLPIQPPTIDATAVSSPGGDMCFSMELRSPLNCQVFNCGVIGTKYGPESSTWTVRVIDEQKLFDEEGEVRELQPFLVLVESKTKEAQSLVANTKLWIKDPVPSGTSVNAQDRIYTILVPKDNVKHPPFTFSRGATYEGILKYRPRVTDRFWRAVGSTSRRDKYQIVEQHTGIDSGITYVSAPSAGIFEPAPNFHYVPGYWVRRNEGLGFILRGNTRTEILSMRGGVLLSTMVRVHEAVHAGQRLFRVRTGPPVLYFTMMPSHADSSYWFEVFSPLYGKFCLEENRLLGRTFSEGADFQRGEALCSIDAQHIQLKIGLDIEGSIMQIFPSAGDEVHFGQLLMLVQARSVVFRSPIVGNFYRAPHPAAEPFVKEGSLVTEGDTLCLIEAIKLENHMSSELDGVIVAILVENGQQVEYGQPLFIIKPKE